MSPPTLSFVLTSPFPLSCSQRRHRRGSYQFKCSLSPLNSSLDAPPPTYHIQSSDAICKHRASAFMIRPNVFLTAAHALLLPSTQPSSPTSYLLDDMHIEVQIEGQKMRFVRYSLHADLALVSPSPNLTINLDWSLLANFAPGTTYTLITPPSHQGTECAKVHLNPVDVMTKMCSFSGTFLPFVRCSFDRSLLSQQSFAGWSGSPVVRDDTNEIVGILIQGDEQYAEILSASTVSLFLKSEKQNLEWRRLKLPGIVLQPLIHLFARRAYLNGDNNEPNDDDEDENDESNGSLLPRIVNNYSTILKDDLAVKVNGHRVRVDSRIEWNGMVAPTDVSFFSPSPTISVQVIREGELVQCEVDTVPATSPIRGTRERRTVIAGGVAFAVLNIGLLRIMALKQGLAGNEQAPEWLQSQNGGGGDWDEDDEIVVVMGFDPDEGWTDSSTHGLEMERVLSVDGVKVRCLEQLVKTGEWMEVRFANGFILKLPHGKCIEHPYGVWTQLLQEQVAQIKEQKTITSW